MFLKKFQCQVSILHVLLYMYKLRTQLLRYKTLKKFNWEVTDAIKPKTKYKT